MFSTKPILYPGNWEENGDGMVDLTPLEQNVVRALQELGATDESKMKTADDVMKKSKMAKGQIANTLITLVNKGVVVRKAREKSAGYFVKKTEG